MQPDSHVTVRPNTRFTELAELTEGSPQAYFPIVDEAAMLVGVVSLNDIRALAATPEVWPVLVAADLGVEADAVAFLQPGEDLHSAARKFSALDLGALPVLDGPPPSRLHAMLTYRQVLQAYDGAVRTAGETSPFEEP
jgi:CBS domain-containing protein